MGLNRMKAAADWFYRTVFKDEAICPRAVKKPEPLPPALRTARGLERLDHENWQSRESLFLEQGRLLAAYEDDYDFRGSSQHYYTTYQSLTDPELRGYFSWRTKVRRGEVRKAPLSFAFLYVYELLNQIGVPSPEDGFRKLCGFNEAYGELDSVLPLYVGRWLPDYVIYYGLDPILLSGSCQVVFDQSIAVLENIQDREPDQVVTAVKNLAPKWLGRSKFYASHTEEMDAVTVSILRKMSGHYAARCKKTMVEQYFGLRCPQPVYLFDAAVFCDPLRRRDYTYTLNEGTVYSCHNGVWSVNRCTARPQPNRKLDALMKTIDSVMREETGDSHPVKAEVETKWILKLIRDEVQALLRKKQETEGKKVVIDYSRLTQIRLDAAETQEKLIVEEEAELPETTLPAPPPAVSEASASEISGPAAPADSSLSPEEYRLLQCLLYGGDTGWVQAEGYLLSVLVDGVNEKMYDAFSDTVLDGTPQLIEDYIDDLKEMVRP